MVICFISNVICRTTTVIIKVHQLRICSKFTQILQYMLNMLINKCFHSCSIEDALRTTWEKTSCPADCYYCLPSVWVRHSHTYTHTHTQERTHIHARIHTHTHAQTQTLTHTHFLTKANCKTDNTLANTCTNTYPTSYYKLYLWNPQKIKTLVEN